MPYRAQFALEPCLGDVPLALDRGGGDPNDVSGLLNTKSREKSQLDDLRLLRILCLERVEGVVQGDYVGRALNVRQSRLFDRNGFDAPAPFRGLPAATVIDEDASHHRRCHTEEVALVVPSNVMLLLEAQVYLVHQRSEYRAKTSSTCGLALPPRS
jgi:hypothetical protein